MAAVKDDVNVLLQSEREVPAQVQELSSNESIDEQVIQPTKCGMKPATFKAVAGLFIVLGIAVSWVGATQFAQSTYSPTFNAPYFTTWFTTCWMMVVFPIYMIPSMLRKEDMKIFFRESEKIFGPRGLRLRSMLVLVAPFCFLWIVTNYLYIRALGEIHAADVTAIFSSSNAFVYILSWLLLKEEFSLVRVAAVFLSIAGIVLFGYAEGFKGGSAVGIILSVASAIGAALYRVLFKRAVGDATASQVSLFLTCLGCLTTLVLWSITVIFHFTQYEKIDWSDAPWGVLCGSAVLALIFNYLINFGIAFTFPLFISLGTVIGIPLNAITDLVFRGKDFGTYKIIAALFIIIGFLFMLIPLDYETKYFWDRIKNHRSADLSEEGSDAVHLEKFETGL